MSTRRDLITLAAAVGAAGCASAAGAMLPIRLPSGTESLDAIARHRGMRFGSAMGYPELSDSRYCGLMRSQCGVMVAENELKWRRVEPRVGVVTFEQGDAMARFASDNHLLQRGHTLLWQNTKRLPDWVDDYPLASHPRVTLEKLLRDHVTRVVKRYPQVISWDVVNEAVSPETGELRETLFTRHIGPEAIDLCYHLSRATAPDAQLVYNDYMNWESTSELHRSGVLRFLEGLRKRNVPVDALGLQSHITIRASHPPEEAAWRRFLDEVTGMGFDLLITEFDVYDDALPTNPPNRDRMIAERARSYLDVTLSYRQLKHVLTWGLIDKYTYMQQLPPRADGTLRRPLPFDSDYQPKPLYFAMAEALRSAPPR